MPQVGEGDKTDSLLVLFCLIGASALFCCVSSETGGICIAPKPSEPDAEIIPGMAMRPFFGIKPVLMDTEVRCLAVCVFVCVLYPCERVRLGL